MSDVLGSIGSTLGGMWGGLSGAQKWLLPLTVFSGISDLMRGHQQQSIVNAMVDRAKAAAALKPEQIAAMAERTAQPLSTGLVENVGNLVQGVMAERGLAQAPGIMATELGARLAPFEQANLDAAYQAVLRQLYAPIEALGAGLSGSQAMGGDFGKLLMAMLMSGRGSSTAGQTAPGAPDIYSVPTSDLARLFPDIFGAGGTAPSGWPVTPIPTESANIPTGLIQ